MRLTPATGSFILGSTFDLAVVMNTGGVAVNTIEADLRFPPDKLQLVNPSLGKSIVQIWASPPTYSNQEGRIYFIGGIPSPGITTSEGIVQSFTFRVTAPGAAQIDFGKNNSILANDGLGTNVLQQTSPASFRLLLPPAQGPKIFSPSHPEQGKWYKDPNPIFQWEASPGTNGFSYALDHDPNGAPDNVVETAEAQASFTAIESGVWYFHVKERAGNSWSGVSHFFVNLDTLPPAEFGVKASPGLRTSNKSPILRFFTTDSLSGFDHFELKSVALKDGPSQSSFFFEASSPYQLSGLKSGRYEIVVRAYDKAGNFRDESVTMNILSSLVQFVSPEGVDFVLFFVPWARFIPTLLVFLVFLVGFVIFVLHRHHHHLRHIIREDLQIKKPRPGRR